MRITFLGTRAYIDASKPYHSNHSGALLDNRILLDLGEETFLSYKPDLVLITHLHPDHAFFIETKEIRKTTIPSIYAPEAYKPFKVQKKTRTFTFDGYTITPIPTIHSKKVKSQAYLIKKKKKKILYTGDLVWIEKKYHHLLHNLDAVIVDGSYLRKGGLVRRDKETGEIFGHKGIPDWIHFFHDATNTIIITHLGSWFFDIPAKKARQKIKAITPKTMDIIIAYDGCNITI